MTAVLEAPEALDSQPAPLLTTLYDLIDAMQGDATPEEADLVVTAVMHLWQTGRLTFLDDAKRLEALDAELAGMVQE